jgi:PKD repeat protein
MPHAHTSYPALAFMLMLVGVLLSGVSMNASAATPVVNPQSGSLGLQGRVTGPPPTTAASILSPRNNSTITSSPVTVSGTCPINTFVSIYKNNVFAGNTPCTDDGQFSLLIDLFNGSNRLIAKVSDALDQAGPDSAAVVVTYQPAGVPAINYFPGSQLFLRSDDIVLGASPGQVVTRTITIVGGQGPYAISWDFGDGKTVLVPQNSEGESKVSHSYERPGTYKVIVRVTDSTGNTAILQVATVINGPVAVAGTGKGFNVPGLLLGAWPLYAFALFLVAAFWLGERRELYDLRQHHRLLPAN